MGAGLRNNPGMAFFDLDNHQIHDILRTFETFTSRTMTASSPVSLPAERLGRLVKELMCLIIERSAGEMLAVMAEADLSMPQMVALHMLQRCGYSSISAIAAHLSLSLAATSHLVDRMVRQGLVVRSEDASDRRHKRVVLTPAGEALLERLVQARAREIAQILAELSPQLREQFEVVLAQVVAQLKEQASQS